MTHRIAVALACLALGLMNAHGHAASIASPDSVRALIAAGRFAEADSAAHRPLEAAHREHGPEPLEAARALDLIVHAMRTWP